MSVHSYLYRRSAVLFLRNFSRVLFDGLYLPQNPPDLQADSSAVLLPFKTHFLRQSTKDLFGFAVKMIAIENKLQCNVFYNYLFSRFGLII